MVEPESLASFLRSRREELSPEDVGLRPTGRRRTPGLRREEVATLAGVSIDYLIRLEQGRDVHPSTEVVAALAEALRLDGEEARRLLGLALRSGSPHLHGLCPETPALDAAVPATVRRLLDGLEPPAFVTGPLGDVLAHNEAWRSVADPIGLTAVGNLARHVFAHPDAASIYRDWERAADAELSRLRDLHDGVREDPAYAALVDDLDRHPAFRRRSGRRTVSASRRRRLDLAVPGGPELRLDVEELALQDPGHHLVTWLPADHASADRLRVLRAERWAAEDGHLRVVAGDHG
jgi:transcriptional regulator with XRE-family HTH domain